MVHSIWWLNRSLCADQYGYVLFGVRPRDILFEDQPTQSTVYDLVRSYISDALCGILLYDQAVRARQQAEEADRLKVASCPW